MYYLELIQKFWNFNQKINIGSTAIAMYLYLLKLGNDTDDYDVTISDVALSNILGITRKTVKPTKEKLRNFGLIQFETKNGLPCNYRLLLNYPIQILEPVIQELEPKDKVQTPKKESAENSQTLELTFQDNFQTIKREDEEVSSFYDKDKFLSSGEIPTLEEFFEYAKTLKAYETSMDCHIKEKYNDWSNNGWRSHLDRPINNWKSSLKSTLPYMKGNDNELSVQSIPNIKRPKTSLKN